MQKSEVTLSRSFSMSVSQVEVEFWALILIQCPILQLFLEISEENLQIRSLK